MRDKPYNVFAQVDIGQQWMHVHTKEPVWILGLEDVVFGPYNEQIVLYVITMDNVRKSMNALTFINDYKYVPPLSSGAYK